MKFSNILLLTCIGGLGGGYLVASAAKAIKSDSVALRPEAESKEPIKLLLRQNNTVTFRSEVDGLSTASAAFDLSVKCANLPSKDNDLYLYLDSPGGDIVSGNNLVDVIKSLPCKVHTVSQFSASMAFNFVQRLDTRYIVPSGTLMAHRARVGGVGGQVPGEFLSMASSIYAYVTTMDRQNAKRLGLTYDEYMNLARDEYWVSGDRAVAENAADAVALIRCDDSLNKTTTEQTFMTMFGEVTLTFAGCPAIANPIGVKFNQDMSTENVIKLKEKLRNYSTFRKWLVREVGSQSR